MKALVLTYDKNRPYTDHMIRCYENLWPDHPFTFVIPGQDPDLPLPPRSIWTPSPPDIASTVNSLLDQADPDEWIYWAIDDKYPIRLNAKAIGFIHRQISSNPLVNCDSILFSRRGKERCRHLLQKADLTLDDAIGLFQQFRYNGIWRHHFLRPKVLRDMFSRFDRDIPSAKAMDDMKSKLRPPARHRLYFTRTQMGIFGESSRQGIITKNCAESMSRMKMPIGIGEANIGSAIIYPRCAIGFHLGRLFCRPNF